MISTPRTARGPGGGFLLVGTVLVLLMFSSSAPSALYVLYQEKWDLSAGVITVVYGVYAVTVLAALLLFGALSDTLGRRPVLLVSLVLVIVSMGLFASAQGLAWLLAARAVQGLAVGLATGATGAALLELAPASRPGLGALVNSAGPPVGIGLGAFGAGLLVEFAPAPTALTYLVLAGAFALALVLLPRLPETAPGAGGAVRFAPHRVRVPAAVRRRFLILALTVVAVWTVGGFYLALGPKLVLVLLGSTNYLIGGATVGLLAGAATATQLLLGSVRPLRAAMLGLGLMIAGLGLVLLSLGAESAVLFLLATAVLGSGWGAAFLGAFRALMGLAAPQGRGELTAAVYVFGYLAMSVPAVLAGMLSNRYGLRAASVGFMAVVAAVCALALAATYLLSRRPTPTAPPAGTATLGTPSSAVPSPTGPSAGAATPSSAASAPAGPSAGAAPVGTPSPAPPAAAGRPAGSPPSGHPAGTATHAAVSSSSAAPAAEATRSAPFGAAPAPAPPAGEVAAAPDAGSPDVPSSDVTGPGSAASTGLPSGSPPGGGGSPSGAGVASGARSAGSAVRGPGAVERGAS